MNLSKREFLQVLGAGTVAGMGLVRSAQADAATAARKRAASALRWMGVMVCCPRFSA